MLNSIAKVSHDLSPGAPQGIRGSRRRGVHVALLHRGDDQPDPSPRQGGGRLDPDRRGARVPGLLRARRAAHPAVAHHVHLGAADADARPVMLFALPQIAVIAALALFISPWAAQMGAQYATKLESRDDVSRVTPGVFGETANKERVFFVESVSGETNQVQNVFLASAQQGRLGISMSRTGRTETAPNGDRFIVLEQGRRYEGAPGDEQFRVTEFERYAARIETRENIEPERNQKNLTTWALMSNPTKENLAELVWRIGIPVSALVLVLLAIPMSFVNPRAGRSANLLFALLTFMVYSNLLSVSQARVSQGRLDFSVGVWLVHAGMVLLLVVLFAQRMQLIRLRLGK